MKRLLSFVLIAVIVAFSGIAYGATTTSTLNVTTTLVPGCAVSTTAVDFGSHDNSSTASANGDVTVSCSNGVGYNIALDGGVNYNVNGNLRRVFSGTDYIDYFLYKDSTYTTAWGDSDYDNTFLVGSSLADTGSGSTQSHTVYGRLQSGSIPSGTYTDVVTVTVYY